MSRSLPGPRGLRFVRSARKLGFLECVRQGWAEYGDVFAVRLGPRTLVFAMHPDMVEHVSATKRDRYAKAASYDGVREFLTGEGLIASNGALWRRQRRLMAPFFTPKSVEAYSELMLSDALRLAERWEQLSSAAEAVEIAEEMIAVTASIILRAMFSSDNFESINRMKRAVETMIDFTNERLMKIPLPLWLPTARNRAYLEARTLVHRSIAELIEQRRQLPFQDWPDDLLSRLMNARDEDSGEGMSAELLRDESITAFFAGHETTARTLTFAWYALAANPASRDGLDAELDAVLGDRVPSLDDLRRLPYTLAVVKETLRLFPAAPFYVRDALEPDEVGGFHVPAGAAVMLSPYFTHRHPDFWEDPEVFRPERWLDGADADQHRYAYHPFATGQRICIGNHFSLLETHILLAVLAQRFAPSLPPGYEPQWDMRGVLSLANGLPMKIVARARAA